MPWLDLIRFTAAFLVVICHVRCEMLQTYSMLQPDSQNIFTQMLYFATGMGKAGVIIFFILSGFLVGGKNLYRSLAGSISLKNYIIDRAIRIGVPLLCSLLLVCLVDYIQLQFEIDNTGMSYGLIAQHSIVEILGNIFGLQRGSRWRCRRRILDISIRDMVLCPYRRCPCRYAQDKKRFG